MQDKMKKMRDAIKVMQYGELIKCKKNGRCREYGDSIHAKKYIYMEGVINARKLGCKKYGDAKNARKYGVCN